MKYLTPPKILILGDIHGRPIWKDIIQKEQPRIVVFLGDYCTTHDDISPEDQLQNLLEILDMKEGDWDWGPFVGANSYSGPDEVIMLRGNHDLQCLGYPWTRGWSGYEKYVNDNFPRERFLKNTQWVYEFNVKKDGLNKRYVCSHAGISEEWLKMIEYTGTITGINKLEPGERFGFTGYHPTGDDPMQSLTWIRPTALLRSFAHPYQIVGHTPVSELTRLRTEDGEVDIWLCDALGVNGYLVLEDNEFKDKKYE